MIRAQDTSKVKIDTSKQATIEIIQQCDSIRTQQNDINQEVKRQLDFLKELMKKDEEKNPDKN
tara:strand:+ start:573 stop:761 length:189 start_codon:yes stop_codon:yes gene_type:complete